MKISIEILINAASRPWQCYREDSELYFETSLVFVSIAVFEIFKVEIGLFWQTFKIDPV